MRKLLLFTLCMALSLVAAAQTSMETALDLVMGSNSYTFDAGGSQSAYYKYTAPAESGMLLTITRPDYTASISLQDGDHNYIYGMSLNSGMTNVYPVESGQTVYVVVSVYSDCTATFEASTEAADLDGGLSCDDPLIASDGSKLYIPIERDENYNYSPIYVAYDATEDGVMEVHLTGYANSFTVQVGCDGESEALTGSYNSAGGYDYKFDVDAENRYIIAIQGYSPQYATFTLTHPTVGSSCDMPFTASTSEANTLPAAAGTYWYQLTSDKQGYAIISTDATLAGGTVKAYSYCGAYTTLASVSGSMYFRCPVSENSSIMICIEKAEATAADETFAIAIEDEKAGDTFANPMELVVGDNTVPMYNGTYYYRLDVPEGESKMLKIDASKAGILSSNTNVALYDISDSYTSVAYGQSSLSKEVAAATSYIVRWVLDEGKNGFTFNVALDDIAAGDVASKPIRAVEGENQLGVASVKYYDYVADKTGWLSIDVADPAVSVSFPMSATNSYSGSYTAQVSGTVSRIQATEGTTYYLVFRGMTEPTSFFLSEENYAEGESKDNPIEITEETTALPEEAVEYWYVYTAPKDGKLVVKSDLEYGYNSSNYVYTSIAVAINDGYEQSMIKYTSSATTFEGSIAVSAGDKAYIHVVIPVAQSGRTLTCYVEDYKEGESSTKPIALEEGELTIPAVSRDATIWYSVELNQGDSVAISSTSYFFAYLYKASDLSNYVCYTSTDYDYDTYVSTYVLSHKHEEATTEKYLINVTSNYAEVLANVTIYRAKGTGIETPSNVSLEDAEKIGVFDLQGRKVATAAQLRTTHLPAGIYVVGGKKVVIK